MDRNRRIVMNEHTPLPWRELYLGSEGYAIKGNTGNKLEDIRTIARLIHKTFEQDKANAIFIVKACNAHEDLLKVAKEAEYALLCVPYAGINSKEYEKFTMAIEKLQSVIAKVEGKE